jgi:hypothetical protein
MEPVYLYIVVHMTWLADLSAKNPAYLDPGSGSFFLQLLIATLMGALFLVGAYWKKVKSFVRNLFVKRQEEEDGDQ